MKIVLLTAVFLLAITGCEEKESRFTTDSENIEAAKKGINAYEAQDWDTWKSLYAEDAEIYDNDWDNALSVNQTREQHMQSVANLESYNWRDEPQYYEEIIDDNGKTWVNFWAVWEGKLKGSDKVIKNPVHLSLNFEDGKVVEQYGFWDNTEFQAEINKMLNTPVEEKQLEESREKFRDQFLNNQNSEVLDDLVADNYMRYENGKESFQGREGLIEGFEGFNTGFNDMEVTNSTTVVTGNSIFVYFTFTGTNTGEFNGQPATGKKVSVDGLAEMKFNSEGKIYEEHVFYNQLDLMQQLGYSLNPPSS